MKTHLRNYVLKTDVISETFENQLLFDKHIAHHVGLNIKIE